MRTARSPPGPGITRSSTAATSGGWSIAPITALMARASSTDISHSGGPPAASSWSIIVRAAGASGMGQNGTCSSHKMSSELRGAAMTTVAPDAISAHLDTEDIPWAVWDDGVEAKVLRVSRETGTWVIINRFAPGKRIPTHHHDGSVHAYTLKGRWHYLEYDIVASPRSFVFEQAGSTHTLEAMPDSEEPVEVFFVIEGGLILYDDDGNYFGYTDAQMALDMYYGALDAAGIPRPTGI